MKIYFKKKHINLWKLTWKLEIDVKFMKKTTNERQNDENWLTN